MIDKAFDENEWNDLPLLNGLDRSDDPDDESGAILRFVDFCKDFLVGQDDDSSGDLTGVPDDDLDEDLEPDDPLHEPGAPVQKWF